jgi:hypothetical protein
MLRSVATALAGVLLALPVDAAGNVGPVATVAL